MVRLSRQFVVLGISLMFAAFAILFVVRSKPTTTNLAFWFETISEDARTALPDTLAGGISPDEITLIEAMARDEVVRAFQDYPVAVVGRTSAPFHVRVVDSINSFSGGSAESYTFPGMGGQGYINFRSLAFSAVIYAPAGANRHDIVTAIGRGIGRSAVHEFTHLLLGRHADIHASQDIQSYEYGSTDRREQYYGEMHWDIAAPMLREKFSGD